MKDAKKLNLNFPELRRLDSVKLIPAWVAKIHAILLENSKDMKIKKVKPLRTLRQEAMKALDAIEPTKMASQIKEMLIQALSKDVPEVLD